MAVSEVIYNGKTLIDLKNDTVTPQTLAEGVTAHDASGNLIEGKLSPENGATFTPSVSEEGMLSWTNDKGLDNPDPVNINGKDGYTPIKGVDYFTSADQEAIVQQVITALGTPVFGRVDEHNNIILTGELADGAYKLCYEDAEGNNTIIGDLKVGVTYTNVLALSTDDNGNVYNNGLGYINNHRISSYSGTSASSGVTETEGYFSTGFIPYTNAQAKERVPFYVKGIELDLSNLGNYNRFALVHANGGADTWYGVNQFNLTDGTSMQITKLADKYYMFKPDGGMWSKNAWQEITANGITGTTHIRFTFAGSGEGVIITVNEPIENIST